MTTDSCLQRPVPKTASATVYLMEELGDARMRCDQLVRYTAEAVKLIEQSSHRDHFFEVAGHLIQALPHTVFLLQKALQATALAATRIDYEEIKQELRPEKVNELERALEDVRIRQVQRRSEPWTPEQTAKALRAMTTTVQKTGSLPRTELISLILGLEFGLKKADAMTAAQALEALAGSLETAQEAPSQIHLATLLRQVLADDLLKNAQEQDTMGRMADEWKANVVKHAANEEKESRFEEGKPADPTQNMSPEDAKKWKVEHDKHKDNFKSAALPVPPELAPQELSQMQAILKEHGYNPADALKLQADGMGPSELEHRITSTIPGQMGSLEYTHNLKKVGPAPGGLAPELGDEMVLGGLEEGFAAMRLAQSAGRMGNYKKMFKGLVGVLSGLGMVGNAFGIQEAHLLVRVMKAYARFAGVSPGGVFAAEGGPSGLVPTFEEMVVSGLEGGFASMRVAHSAGRAGNYKKMFKHLVGVLSGLSFVGQGFEIPEAYVIVRVLKAFARFAGVSPSNVLASDERESMFEEGKPADPTENMSPEDAKKWKTEHDKNKDNFKSAALRNRPLGQGVELGELSKEMARIANEMFSLRGDFRTIHTAIHDAIEGYPMGMGPLAQQADSVFARAKALDKDLEEWDHVTGQAANGLEVVVRDLKKAKSASDEEKESRFEEGKSADPTENMSPEDAKKWKTEHEKNKDNFKSASSLAWKA